MNEVTRLVADVSEARKRFIRVVRTLNLTQASFKKEASSWTICEITEHLVHAEDIGVNGIWRALEGYNKGEPVWSGDKVHSGVAIEEIAAATWKEKEQAPDIARPRMGGTLAFWIANLRVRQGVLEELAEALHQTPLDVIVYPHPISGPLDARQRLEFLRFHIDRHLLQVNRVIADPKFSQE